MSDSRLHVFHGDMTQMKVDALVNAANHALLGGGGVDGAIHRAAGPELLEFCRGLGGCATGEAKLSPGFRLPARYVIHTVGPVWRGGDKGEAEQLARCYRNSLALAQAHGFETVAFPAISTGAYGYPPEAAADIAVREIQSHLALHALPQTVFLVSFNEQTRALYAELLGKLDTASP